MENPEIWISFGTLAFLIVMPVWIGVWMWMKMKEDGKSNG